LSGHTEELKFCDNDNDTTILEMSQTPRREPEEVSGTENAKDPLLLVMS
jgi:hypothetical protein